MISSNDGFLLDTATLLRGDDLSYYCNHMVLQQAFEIAVAVDTMTREYGSHLNSA